MEDMIEALQIYFSRANAWTPLWVTLKTGIAATFITFFTGLFAAARVMRLPSGKKAVADSILTLPIVLPPTVVGFVLLLLFSRNRLLGKTLNLAFGVVIPGTWAACVIAAVVISFPLMYRNTRAAFEQMDVTMIYAARTLGLSEWEIFWKISVPNALPGIASGTVLAFAGRSANTEPHPCLPEIFLEKQVPFLSRLLFRWSMTTVLSPVSGRFLLWPYRYVLCF